MTESVVEHELRIALQRALDLQAFYVQQLNRSDGGQRREFTVDEWIAALRKTGDLPKLEEPAP